MLNYRAIAYGAALLLLIALPMGLLLRLVGDGGATATQILTATSLWSFAGFYAARSSCDAGLLHGMLAGLSGGAVLVLMVVLLRAEGIGLAPLREPTLRSYLMLLVVGGLWGGVGGLFADIMRAGRARRAQRRAARDQRDSGRV